MVRRFYLAMLVAVGLPAYVSAQAVPQFKWTPNQTLRYRVLQTTTATETVEGKTQETTTTLELTKRWQVKGVDQAGVATLTMSLDKLRMETKTPKGETMLFDSAQVDKSTPGMKEEMAKYLGVPLTTIRMDATGKLIEVKESKFGPASRLESDLPFKIVLPGQPLTSDLTWTRKYQIKLEPPQGAGESYDAEQKYTVKSQANGQAILGLTTELKTQPGSMADMVPLVPLQPAGEVAFDIANGRLRAVRFQIKKDIDGHAGDGSKYRFVSNYAEDWVEK